MERDDRPTIAEDEVIAGHPREIEVRWAIVILRLLGK